MLLVMVSFFHECALQLVAMHYILVSGMESGKRYINYLFWFN